jgi:hypothetical protein
VKSTEHTMKGAGYDAKSAEVSLHTPRGGKAPWLGSVQSPGVCRLMMVPDRP